MAPSELAHCTVVIEEYISILVRAIVSQSHSVSGRSSDNRWILYRKVNYSVVKLVVEVVRKLSLLRKVNKSAGYSFNILCCIHGI